MVVLAAAVCTKAGKALVSRQFVEMTRMRIEALLAAFPKLLGETADGSRSKTSRQHTFVETDSVRYVYQPVEDLFLVVVTTRGSNIVQDLETLRLLAKVLPEYCGIINEEEIIDAAFDVVFAFDEVVSLGYKENITLQGIRTNLEMDSHEEKLHLMIKESKEKEAKEEMKRKAKVIKEQKREMARMEQTRSGMPGMGSRGFGGGMGGGGMGGGGMGGGGMGGSSYGGSSSYERAQPQATSKPEVKKSTSSSKRGPRKGMQLGKKKKASNFLDAMAAEDGIDTTSRAQDRHAESQAQAVAPGAIAPRVENIQIYVDEKVSVVLNRDGGLEGMEVKGSMQLTCNEESQSRLKLVLDKGANKGYIFQTHPNISKPMFKKSVLALKNSSRSFPLGNPIGVVRWKHKTSDESEVPLSINCWPERVGDGVVNVNIEYSCEVDFELNGVVICIPLGGGDAPEIVQADGIHRYNSRLQQIEWEVGIIDESNQSGSLEFNVAGGDEDAFFPVTASFSSETTLAEISVTDVLAMTEEDPEGSSVKFQERKVLSVDRYEVVSE